MTTVSRRKVELATMRSIKAAGNKLTPMDEGAREALLWLARKMDLDEDANPRLTATAYVNAAAQLGLTVLGRERIAQASGVPTEQPTVKAPDVKAKPVDETAEAFDELKTRRSDARRNRRPEFRPDTA